MSAAGTVLVLGSDRREGLAVVRSLGRAGYRVIAGHTALFSYVSTSRFAARHWRHPPLNGASLSDFLDALQALSASEPALRFVFPTGDLEIDALHGAGNRLPGSLTLVACSAGVRSWCASKTRLLQKIDGLPVPVARWSVAQRGDSIMSHARAVGFPCVLKPDSESAARLRGQKALKVSDADALRALLGDAAMAQDAMIVQRMVEGARHNVYFLACAGRLLHTVEVRIDRTEHPAGTGYAVAGQIVGEDARLVAAVGSVVEALGYHGAGCAQFMLSDTEVTFLEVNARIGANCAIAAQCGLDIPLGALQLSEAGAEAVTLGKSGRIRARYSWFWGDLAGLAKHARRLGVKATAAWLYRLTRSVATADIDLIWCWRDPWPALSYPLFKTLNVLTHRQRRAARASPQRA